MISYLRHNEIDKTLWDERLAKCSHGRVYACSWYLDIVSPNWQALVWGNYETFMPLPVRNRFGFTYLGIPPFTQQLGIFSIHDPKKILIKEFLSNIPGQIRHYDLFLNAANNINLSSLADTRTTQVLPLNAPYAELYKAYSDNVKRNLKKASGFHIVENLSPADTVKMFAAEKAHQVGDIKQEHLSLLENIITYIVQHTLGYCRGIANEHDELLASACFVQWGKRIYFLKGSSTEKGKQQGAMHLLLNSVIENNSGTDREFDFSGSVIPGLYRFYKSFGAKDELYLHIREYKLLPGLLKKLALRIKRFSV